MAGRARADTPAGMIDLNPVCEGDIQNATRQASVTIRNLLGFDFNRHIHGKKRDREFFCRWSRRLLINVRIRTAHATMVTLFHGGELLKDGIYGRPIAGIASNVLPYNLSFLIHDEH